MKLVLEIKKDSNNDWKFLISNFNNDCIEGIFYNPYYALLYLTERIQDITKADFYKNKESE